MSQSGPSLYAMAIAHTDTVTEPNYSSMTTLEIIDQLEFEMDRNPALPQGLIWEVVGRLAATEPVAP